MPIDNRVGVGAIRSALRALAIGLCLLSLEPLRSAEPQLYAIAGQPDRDVHSHYRIPVVLYRVGDGTLAKVRTVATRRQGAVLVRAYRERGHVFVVSEGAKPGSFLVDILDLGDLSRQRSADFDVCAGCGYDEAHLLERDGRLTPTTGSPRSGRTATFGR